MKIAVLMGGPSSEREVSLKSGAAVYEALVSLGHNAIKIDLDQDIVHHLKSFGTEVVFNVLHGKPGEDGSIQGLLELMGIPYTGSGILASALTMDKVVTKQVLTQAGIPTPEYLSWTATQYKIEKEKIHGQILNKLGLPVVIKAPSQGSTIGVHIVRQEEKLGAAIEEAIKYEQRFMAEAFLPGPELTAAVIGNDHPKVLPLIEIVSHTGFYDYTAKYTPGLSEHIIPPKLPGAIVAKATSLASQAHIVCGCRGFSRVDFIVAEGQTPHVIEINSVPGMTSTSLVPDAARAAGFDFPSLIQKIVDLALEK